MTDTKAPNEALARAIAEAGCTYQALATTVRAVASEAGEHLATAPSAVAHWVAGGTPTGRTPQYLAEALTRRTRRKVTVAEIGLASIFRDGPSVHPAGRFGLWGWWWAGRWPGYR
ncbi:hypothetical protein ACFVYI_38460, partial [Kitasatospora sp. NPDC058218]